MLIDFHTHAYPNRIAASVLEKLTPDPGTAAIIPQTRGTLASLKEEMVKEGVDISVVLSIATNPKQQTNVNNFAMECNQENGIFAFGSVHPDAPNALEELERIHAAGLKGVKFHPEYQHFFVDDEKMRPIYRKISELGLITLFHAGKDFFFQPPYHGTPEHLLGALKWLDAPVVAAHWGAGEYSEDVLKYLCGLDLYFDTSFGYGLVPRDVGQAIVDKHGPDKILFASDMPWHRPSWELSLLDTLDLSPSDRDKILFQNAAKLLNLPAPKKHR